MTVVVRRDWIEDLYDRHAGDVLAYARRRTDDGTAEEIVVDVFVVAWKRSADVPETEPVLWLYGVARRLLANARRAGRRREALITALRGTARGETDARDEDSPLLEALGALRPADREVLMLSAWEGLDARQIAAVLDRSEPAVHQRLHRARARLQTQLEARAPRTLTSRSTMEAPAHD
jgi:RNA polymerase sigma-70 factor (ECF subfamily)